MQFLFADHTLDTDTRELCRGGTPIAIQPQAFDLLTYLVRNRDRVVSKDDSMQCEGQSATAARNNP